jgi:hypothetical protein
MTAMLPAWFYLVSMEEARKLAGPMISGYNRKIDF